MPTGHPAAWDEQELLAACTVTHGRRSGPGGQHRNKTQTAVNLTFPPTANTAQASERRSQRENLRVALRRLRMKLALEQRGHFPPHPSPLWMSRARGGKLPINPDHQDFPALLAELLDALERLHHDPRRVAVVYEVTPSQVVKLLKLEPEALQRVNRARQERNEHPLQ